MKAAIRVGMLMFTGQSHAKAMDAALASELVPLELKRRVIRDITERTENTGFAEDDGTFITRAQAKAKYGCSTSEEMTARGLI